MGKLQNEDFKTEAELTGAGGAKSQLLNDTKVYVTGNSINKTLDDAIIDGDIGGGVGTDSTVRVRTANGQGSTNNAIRRFSTVDTNTGTAITYADSATLGGSFTINEDGVYAISCFDERTGGIGRFGISLNSTQLGIAIQTINATDRIAYVDTSSANVGNCCVTLALTSGDVVRSHNNGSMDAATVYAMFTITKVEAL